MTLMKPTTFSPILAFIGIVLYMAAKKDSKRTLVQSCLVLQFL
jgi:hypothetical protein